MYCLLPVRRNDPKFLQVTFDLQYNFNNFSKKPKGGVSPYFYHNSCNHQHRAVSSYYSKKGRGTTNEVFMNTNTPSLIPCSLFY